MEERDVLEKKPSGFGAFPLEVSLRFGEARSDSQAQAVSFFVSPLKKGFGSP